MDNTLQDALKVRSIVRYDSTSEEVFVLYVVAKASGCCYG